jgi:FK506-binding nuclear protein
VGVHVFSIHPNITHVQKSRRFEEIHEENVKGAQAKAQKRSAESMEVDATEPKLSKAEKKKKRKGDDGKPVAVEAAEVKAAEPAVEKSDKKKEKKVGKKADGPTGKITELPGGLKIQDATTGEGKMAKKGSTVSMRVCCIIIQFSVIPNLTQLVLQYIGKLTNGQVFDKNTKGKPFTFHLGAGEVIKGWDQGIVGMQPGGERTLTVPAPLAYGKRSMPGIPSNSTLIFGMSLAVEKF